MTPTHSSTSRPARGIPSTRITRVPGDRPHAIAFTAVLDDQVIGTFATHAAAQEALDAARYAHLRRQPAPVPSRPLSGADLAALWAHDRAATVRFLAGLAPTELGMQALLHSQWLQTAHGRTVDPLELVQRYQRILTVAR
jgi:hypothetical protein